MSESRLACARRHLAKRYAAVIRYLIGIGILAQLPVFD